MDCNTGWQRAASHVGENSREVIFPLFLLYLLRLVVLCAQNIVLTNIYIGIREEPYSRRRAVILENLLEGLYMHSYHHP